MDPCGGLLMLILGLGVLALIGHVIWISVAAVGRMAVGPAKGSHTLRCPSCSHDLELRSGRCAACDCIITLPRGLRPADQRSAFEEKLRQLRTSGVINDEEFDRIIKAPGSQVHAPPPHRFPVTQPAASIFITEAEVPVATPSPSAVPPALADLFAGAQAPVAEVPTIHETSAGVLQPSAGSSLQRVDIPSHLKSISADTRSAPAAGPPAPALSDLMRTFMDENNIRWGELISGLLIVGSAIGLVISLWETLKDSIPYFPALLFMLVTASIHGAGMYTLHRWNLKSTSRGLLLISLFLVPLNYLAAVALSDHRSASDFLFLAAMGTGLAVFGAMSYFASRKLLLTGWWLLPVGVMGASAGQVVISRLAVPGISAIRVSLLFLTPLAAFLATSLGQLQMAARWSRLTARRTTQIFLVTGVAGFALLVAAGILLWKCHGEGWRLILGQLAPSFSIVAAVLVGTGGLIHQRLSEKSMAAWRTAGTAVALTGGAAMLLCLVLAWPDPELLVAVGLVNFVALTGLALVLDVAVLHLPALASVALAGLIGLHLGQQHLIPGADGQPNLLAVLLWGESGFALMCGSILSAGLAPLWRRFGRPQHTIAYFVGSAGLGAASCLIAGYAGFWSGIDGDLATAVFAVYAIAILVADQFLTRSWLGWIGSALALIVLIHGLAWNDTIEAFLANAGWQPARPVIMALLLHGTLLAGLAFLVPRRLRASDDRTAIAHRKAFVAVRTSSALLSTMPIPVFILIAADDPFFARSAYGFWGAAIWLAVAFVHESAAWFAAAQVLATGALCLSVTGVCERQAWWSGPLLHPRHLYGQMGSLAVWAMLWSTLRRLWRSRVAGPRVDGHSDKLAGFSRALISAPWPAVDRIVLTALVVSAPILAALACAPGMASELQSVAPIGIHDLGWILALFILVVTAALCASVASTRFRVAASVPAVVATVLLGSALALPMGSQVANAYWQHAGGAPSDLYGGAGWIVSGLVMAALIVALLEQASEAALYGGLWLLLCIPLLAAGPFESQVATASALRWGLAIYGAAVVASLAVIADRLRRHSPALASPTGDENRETAWTAGAAASFRPAPDGTAPLLEPDSLPWADFLPGLRDAGLALTAIPLLILTVDTVVPAAMSGMLRGPTAGSLFARLGAEWSVAGPLLILAATFCGVALVDRLSNLALAASFTLQLAVATVFVNNRSARGVSIHSDTLAEFIAWNGFLLGVFSVAWIALRGRIEPVAIEAVAPPRPRWSPVNIQMCPTALFGLILPVWAAVDVVLSPGRLPEVMSLLGSPLSYAALGVSAIALLAHLKERVTRWGVQTFVVAGLAFVALGAATAATGNTADNWVSYHILMAGSTLMAVATTIACVVPAHIRGALSALTGVRPLSTDDGAAVELAQLATVASRCTSVVGGLVLFLAARGVATDPARPYWGVATAGILAAIATILGLWRRSQLYAYTSARLAALAASYAWTTPWLGLGSTPTPQSWVNLAEATGIAATLASSFWLAIELWFLRNQGTPFDPTFAYPPVHRGTSRLALFVIAALSVAAVAGRWFAFSAERPIPFDVSNAGGWMLAGLLASVFVGSIWDKRAKRAIPSLYALGLSAAGLALNRWGPTGDDVPYFIGHALALYALLTGVLWILRDPICEWGRANTVPEPEELQTRTAAWLPEATFVLATLVAAIEFWVVLTFNDLSWRLAGAGACAVAALSLPGFAQQGRRSQFRELGLVFAGLAAVDFGWAAMPVDSDPHFWLQRAVRLLVMLAGTTFAYGVVSVRIVSAAGEWFAPLRRIATVFGAAALGSLVAVLSLEAWWFDPVVGAPLTGVQIGIVAVMLVGLAAALISLAVLPGRDPLELSEAGRMLYVYAAEGVLTLLFLHIYLTMPELFKGYLLPWWPLVVMGIAFFGVAVGELFRRSGLKVLSEPLHRTGAFLPLLPALGFWVHSSNSSYSTLLFVVGLLYVVVSIWRQTFLYNLAAALAGNAGLWALWHEHGVQIADHPQLWLIPPALSVLVAVQLNRNRLPDDQVTGLRYLCTTVIYVSSTGDMFITGIADSLLMPMILAGLSVVGALTGIALRVRAFLYLGLSFLLLSIVSMVWHAAQNINHVWPWWAFGIGLGLTILTILGVFEKKRQEVQGLLEEFRQWEA